MASRSAGTLLTEFNAAYVPPGLMPGYQGHVPSVAFSFGSPYGTTTLKYFQDHRNAAMEKSHTPFSQGGHFPTLFSTNPHLLLMLRTSTRDRWLHKPSYTRFNLDSHRSTELTHFYEQSCSDSPGASEVLSRQDGHGASSRLLCAACEGAGTVPAPHRPASSEPEEEVAPFKTSS
nr:protein FAM166C isoform X3 [Saimiri boliviensis boliviensis]